MRTRPMTAMAANHTRMIGPKNAPTLPVPRLCMANRPIRIAMESGTTAFSKVGATTVRPSTADMTDSAGVMAASP
jgi:hypothetical protein